MKKLLQIAMIALIAISSTIQAADEGIKVHGHWTFNIYNADGSFDRKVEFDNSLTSVGASVLLKVIGGVKLVQWLGVKLEGNSSTGDSPCKDNSGVVTACLLGVGAGGDPTVPEEFSLSQAFDDNTNPTKIILSGSIVTASGLTNPNIGTVYSRMGYCDADTTTNPCGSTFAVSNFTSKVITPVSLTSGQIVQVTVEISFS